MFLKITTNLNCGTYLYKRNNYRQPRRFSTLNAWTEEPFTTIS